MKTQAIRSIRRMKPKGIKNPFEKNVSYMKKYHVEFLEFKQLKTGVMIYFPDKPWPAKFFISGDLIEQHLLVIRRFTITQVLGVLLKSHITWTWYSFLIILKKLKLLDVDIGSVLTINKFTFKIWYENIKIKMRKI